MLSGKEGRMKVIETTQLEPTCHVVETAEVEPGCHP